VVQGLSHSLIKVTKSWRDLPPGGALTGEGWSAEIPTQKDAVSQLPERVIG
jgi:hypothetical protein